MGEDAGEEVGLQFEADREAVVFLLGDASLLAVDAVGEAEDLLDVVGALVGDHVGLREIAGGAEALRELGEEGRIEID
jgi:hypothetical protein